MKIKIFVTADFVGFHCWPDAPDEVAFLRNVHRHKFGVKVVVEVNHGNRELEFFILKNKVLQIIKTNLMPALRSKQSMSCEMMAQLIGEALLVFNLDLRSVEVNEDGENGGIVEWDPF